MSEMIDKVAMAIASELDEGLFYNSPAFQKAAKAAIETMRQPTEAMMELVEERHGFRDASIYQPFIDAALVQP